jgi:carboxyl-terminal processing protease
MKRAGSEYKTRLEPIDTVMPLVVLVNGETASASEITSGALQDLKRGVVIGTKTYGKGLVQIPNVDLPYNANLKLTTSRYYLPSGRGIKMKEGITPDLVVKPDTMANITLYLDRLDSTEVMFDYVVEYIAQHPTIAPAAEFHISDADWQAFKERVIKSGFTYDPVSKKQFAELVKTAKFEGYYDDAKPAFDELEKKLNHDVAFGLDRNEETIRRILESEIISAYYYQAGAIEASLNYDKQLKEAIRLLKNPEEYKKLLAPQKPKDTSFQPIKLRGKSTGDITLKEKKMEIFSAIA